MSIIIENVKNKKSLVEKIAEKNPGRSVHVIKALATMAFGEGVTDEKEKELREKREELTVIQKELEEKRSAIIAEKQAIMAEINGLTGTGTVEFSDALVSLAESENINL